MSSTIDHPVPDRFAVWAPRADRVRLWRNGSEHPMASGPSGWWVADPAVATPVPGDRYGFLLDDDTTALPDPRSPRQPDGVHAPSQVIGPPATAPGNGSWPGRSVRGGLIYELHVGTFTPGGTLDAAVERLDHLVELGVDFVELMPLNAFNGPRGWGYDGVGWFAVHEPYGGPEALERFVAAAHGAGLGVLLDVVHNHLGPSGNYLGRFGPYERDDANTWGSALDLSGPDSAEVRALIIDNALWWLRRFGIDGLRLDAVHALVDDSPVHLLAELAERVDALADELGRPLSLIAESDLNDPRLIEPASRGGYGLTAQWDDDVHHAIHAIVSGERQGYYADFGSPECLAKVLTRGFFHDGTHSSFRGRTHGHRIDPEVVAPTRLVAYPTTHDQVGNRARGDRPSEYLTPGQLLIKGALVLFSGFTPMLFMGEEWGASTPFRFFTSHPEPELGRATAKGRRAEFAEHGWPAGDVPDPQDEDTFAASRLDWSEVDRAPHVQILATYRSLISMHRRLRRGHDDLRAVRCEHPGEATWFAVHRPEATLLVNFASEPVTAPFTGLALLAWDSPVIAVDHVRLPPHSFVVLRRHDSVR